MPLANLQAVAAELRSVVSIAAQGLSALGEEAARKPRAPGKWSPKQVVGHLIDSAANNHQRFVRLQLGTDLRFPGYGADDWVRVADYQALPWAELLTLWSTYNAFLAHLLERVPAEAQAHTWIGEDGPPIDLAALAIDYLRHLRHHLGQVKVA